MEKVSWPLLYLAVLAKGCLYEIDKMPSRKYPAILEGTGKLEMRNSYHKICLQSPSTPATITNCGNWKSIQCHFPDEDTAQKG